MERRCKTQGCTNRSQPNRLFCQECDFEFEQSMTNASDDVVGDAPDTMFLSKGMRRPRVQLR